MANKLSNTYYHYVTFMKLTSKIMSSFPSGKSDFDTSDKIHDVKARNIFFDVQGYTSPGSQQPGCF